MSKTIKRVILYSFLAIAIAGAGYFASLHVSRERPLTAEDKVLKKAINKDDEQVTVLKRGSFNPNATDSDDLHRGRGDVELVKFMGETRLVLKDNFHVTNGPDYKLYLLNHSNVQTEERFKQIKEQSHQLDSIKQFSGFQVFTIPGNIDPNEIKSVLVWCEAFSQFISNADLQ